MIEIAKNIGEAIAIILIAGASVIQYINTQKKRDVKKNKTEVSTNLEKVTSAEAEILKYMEYIKEASFADRVLLFEFHNGGHYADGRIATKTSCTFETVRHPVELVQANYQGIQLSRIVKGLKYLFDKEFIEEMHLEDILDIDAEAYRLLELSNVKKFYIRLIRNEKSNPIGFMLIEYCSNENKDINPDYNKITEYFGVIRNKLFDLSV